MAASVTICSRSATVAAPAIARAASFRLARWRAGVDPVSIGPR
jgi:hypothetical protein